MTFDVVTIGIALFGAYTGGVSWGLRLEGRVDGMEIKLEEREKLASARHEELVNRLTRIERKLDGSE